MRVAVQRLPGVQKVEVSLNQGLATIHFRPNSRVTIEQVREVVRRNGFTPKAAEVEVSGTLSATGELSLLVPGWDAPLPLLADSTVRRELSQLRGGRATLRGMVPESDPAPAGRLVLEVRGVGAP